MSVIHLETKCYVLSRKLPKPTNHTNELVTIKIKIFNLKTRHIDTYEWRIN